MHPGAEPHHSLLVDPVYGSDALSRAAIEDLESEIAGAVLFDLYPLFRAAQQ